MKIKCPEAQIGKCDNKKCQDYYWHEEYEACGDVCPKRPSKDTTCRKQMTKLEKILYAL
jgi:hypothetical protein